MNTSCFLWMVAAWRQLIDFRITCYRSWKERNIRIGGGNM